MKKKYKYLNANSHLHFYIHKLLKCKCSNSRFEFLLNRKLLNSKRSQSEIISTILLILLVVVAATLLFAFVIPFIKERMNSGDCLDVVGKVEVSSGYTCWDTDKMQVQVYVADIRDLIEGVSIELGGASTNNYKINGTNSITGVSMCNGTSVLALPGNNEERTYVITSAAKPNVIRVYPILKGGKVCDASDTATTIDDCFGPQKCSI